MSETWTGGVKLAGSYTDLGVAVTSQLHGLDALAAGLSAPGDYLTKTNIAAEFVPRLFDYLVVETISDRTNFALGVALFTGIIELKPFPRNDSIFQVAHVRRIVHWDRVPRVFGDISGLIKEVYGWGAPNFDATPEIVALGAILHGLSLPNPVRALPRLAEHKLTGIDVPDADLHPATQLLLSLKKPWVPRRSTSE
jgi:hypothetical protein